MSELIVDSVLDALNRIRLVQVEVSARHVHLSQSDLEVLFGMGAELTPKRPLSQVGQFLSEERVTLIGSKERKERIAVLGPCRGDTQVELSRSDCVELGIDAPVRLSGDVAGSGAITIEGPRGKLNLLHGAIVARNHVHLTPEVAKVMDLTDMERVTVEIFTERPIAYQNVIVRISERGHNRMHIDFDEANAAFVEGFTLGRIIKQLQ